MEFLIFLLLNQNSASANQLDINTNNVLNNSISVPTNKVGNFKLHENCGFQDTNCSTACKILPWLMRIPSAMWTESLH